MTQQITKAELIDILLARKGACFVGISAEYDMDAKGKMLAASPFRGKGLLKLSETTILVTFDYDKSLQRRSDGEERAKGGPTWQQRVVRADGTLTPLTTHKSDVDLPADEARFYLSGEFQTSSSRYAQGGETVEKANVEPWLPTRNYGAETVAWRTVALQNLNRVSIDKETYIIV